MMPDKTASRNKNGSYFWVIGGGLLQVPLVSEVKKLGYMVITSDANQDCPCAKISDIFLNIDIFDIQGHLENAFRLRCEGIAIKGVLVAGIDCTVTGAVLARVLGLPGIDPKIAYITNNKHLFRQVLKDLGYPVPKYKAIGPCGLDDIPPALEDIGFPIIVKNTDSSGSRGTRIFHRRASHKEIKNAVKEAQAVSRSKVALIEEFWVGEEYTVETIFDINAKFHPCFITDRIFDKKDGYAIELGLRNPSALPADVQKKIYSLVESVATDLGINIGAAKADIVLTDKGPRILEMTVRLSGGFDCQYLVPYATGKEILRAAILTALGEQFSCELLEDKKNRVGLTGSVWPQPGRIITIDGVEEARKIPGCEEIFFRYNVGDVVHPYIDCTKRVCFIIVTGKDEVCARNTLKQVTQSIKIKTTKKGL